MARSLEFARKVDGVRILGDNWVTFVHLIWEIHDETCPVMRGVHIKVSLSERVAPLL